MDDAGAAAARAHQEEELHANLTAQMGTILELEKSAQEGEVRHQKEVKEYMNQLEVERLKVTAMENEKTLLDAKMKVLEEALSMTRARSFRENYAGSLDEAGAAATKAKLDLLSSRESHAMEGDAMSAVVR